MDLVRSGGNSSPDELMDLDLAGERRHAGRQCAGEGRRRQGCEDDPSNQISKALIHSQYRKR
ncbi:hypothetical protein U1Q18_009481 [Sarracenia purpurea var. burkii]